MNELKSFTFYRNYFELIKYLPNEDRLELYDAIFKYMFEDEEPNLIDLKKGIFLISSASVRSIPFLSFIEPIFA